MTLQNEIVNFLKKPESYPSLTGTVKVKETHMSWVFITDKYVYKLKKPVSYPFLNLTNLKDRRINCEEELRLNKRLAPGVYLGLSFVSLQEDLSLTIEGNGKPVEWLIKMQKLPEERMLDNLIISGNVHEEDLRQAAKLLASFYHSLPIENIQGEQYLLKMQNEVYQYLNELKNPAFEIEIKRIEDLQDKLWAFLHKNPGIFKARSNKIVEAHGDLRPEHICLIRPPVIIDSLEFDKNLRLLDPFEELSFLALECEFLGAIWVGDFFNTYFELSSKDQVAKSVTAFYKSKRAILRSLLCYKHILEDNYRKDSKWIRKGFKYLNLAEKYSEHL